MDKRHFSKYESGNTADKNDFIGKKRYESSTDHSYSRDRNSSHIRNDCESKININYNKQTQFLYRINKYLI